MRNAKKRTFGQKIGHAALILALAGALWMGWGTLRPLLGGSAALAYESRTVQTGDIETSMSFSATISVRYLQTVSASERTAVGEVYVASGQDVEVGDKLLKLLNGTVYESEIDGTVNQVSVSAGDAVWPNSTLVQVSNFDNMQTSLRVDEYDIKNVFVGQKCSVTVVSLGLTFETEIKRINRTSASTSSVAYYTVTAEIDAPESVLPGMQATVTIPDRSAKGVAVLDMDALAVDDGGNPYVLVRGDAGSYDRKPVKVGVNDGMRAEIVDGLSEGDTVYVVSGTETAESLFSLRGIYKALFGEKTVINDMTTSGGRRFGGGEMPEGMELPEDMELPEGMEFPEDVGFPEGTGTAGDQETNGTEGR